MADKYLDHGVYNDAEFTAHIHNSDSSTYSGVAGTKLYVSAISSGVISVGTVILGWGGSGTLFVSSLGTGTGGVGSYNISALTDGYATQAIASRAMSGRDSSPTITPTWNVAQDGDGAALTTPVPATVSVDMSGWTFTSGSSSFQVMGCTAITIGAGANSATNAQYSATYATMLANIVAAINLATAATINIPSGWMAQKVRDAVYARANGNNLELMTRSGSADWNTRVALQFINVTGSSPQSWANGVSGPWGYAFNGGNTIWPSAQPMGTYGLFYWQNVLAGKAVAGDTVHVRTKRGGQNVFAYHTVNSSLVLVFPYALVTEAPLIIKADAGVKWSGDSGVFTIYAAGNTTSSYQFGTNATTQRLFLIGSPTTGTGKNFKFDGAHMYATNNLYLNRFSYIEGVEFRGPYWSQYQYPWTFGQTSASSDYTGGQHTMIVRCTFTCMYGNGKPQLANQSYANMRVEFVDCDFVGNQASAATGVIGQWDGTIIYAFYYRFVGCRFTGYAAGCSAMWPTLFTTGNWWPRQILFENCSFSGITKMGSGVVRAIGVTTAAGNGYLGASGDGFDATVSIVDTLPGRRFFIDRPRFQCEWNPASSWPTLNATLPETYGAGLSKWVYRVQTAPSTTDITAQTPVEVIRQVRFNTLGANSLTITCHLLVDNNIESTYGALTTHDIVLMAQYTGDDGNLYTEYSANTVTGTPSNLSSTTENWSVLSYDIDAARHDYTRRKATMTTAHAVKSGSEMFLSVLVGKTSPTPNDWYFFDPELLLATA